jgi:acetyl-CoA synthetase
MNKNTALKRLLSPETITVFGGNDAAEAINQCRATGFDGEIWAVNPKREELNGVPCYKSVAELPSAPDSSFIAAPPAASIAIIRELAGIGAGGAVCFASGFAEIGGEGTSLQNQLREAAGDMAIIGPNCHGFLNYLDNVALWPDQHGGKKVESGVALVLQSGNFGINLSMQQRGLDLGYIITIGNKSCLGLHDYIEYLIKDPRVTAIGLHVEGIEQVHKFSLAAIKALKAGISIVAIKTGRSARGAEINMSHTASLAGTDQLYEALFRRLGIARCNTVMQFLETLKFVSSVGTLQENTLGSMSCSGGEASLIADCADATGLDMPVLSDESVNELSDILGPKVPLSNPLDYHTYAWGDRDKLQACFSAMLKNRFACTMLVLDYPPQAKSDTTNWEIAEQALADAIAATGARAVIVSTLPETMPADVRARLKIAGITPMQGLEECLFAIRSAVIIGHAQREAANILPVMEPVALQGEPVALDEWQSKAELAKFGLQIPEGKLCDRDETTQVAEMLGFPVVLKAVSADIAHKSEIGAVAVNLDSQDALADATATMAKNFDRFLIEKMAGPTIAEIIIGVSRDESFGLTLLLGAGGTMVELLDDTASLLLPVQQHEIETAIRTLKVARLIDSFRGAESGDLDAVVDAVAAVAEYAVENSAKLAELDVNPLIVLSKGAIAVDAYIRKS